MKVKYLNDNDIVCFINSVISVMPTDNANRAVIEYCHSDGRFLTQIVDSKKLLSITIVKE